MDDIKKDYGRVGVADDKYGHHPPPHSHYHLVIGALSIPNATHQVIYFLPRSGPSLASLLCNHTGCMILHKSLGKYPYMERTYEIEDDPGVSLELMILDHTGAAVATDPNNTPLF